MTSQGVSPTDARLGTVVGIVADAERTFPSVFGLEVMAMPEFAGSIARWRTARVGQFGWVASQAADQIAIPLSIMPDNGAALDFATRTWLGSFAQVAGAGLVDPPRESFPGTRQMTVLASPLRATLLEELDEGEAAPDGLTKTLVSDVTRAALDRDLAALDQYVRWADVTETERTMVLNRRQLPVIVQQWLRMFVDSAAEAYGQMTQRYRSVDLVEEFGVLTLPPARPL